MALPLNTATSEVLQPAQSAGPSEVLGPSAVVEVAAAAWDLASPLTPPAEMDGQRIQILLMDFSNQVVEHLKEVADSELLDSRPLERCRGVFLFVLLFFLPLLCLLLFVLGTSFGFGLWHRFFPFESLWWCLWHLGFASCL